MFRRVLLCCDGSSEGRRALRRGADLAVLVGAEVFVLCIVPDPVISPSVAAAASGHPCLVDERLLYQHSLDESVSHLTSRGVKAKGYLASGNTIKVIVDHAQRLAVDLIVIGHYPSISGRRWWSGSERVSLAEQVKCCVFIAVSDGG